MPSDQDELDATTDIVTLAEHADGLGKSTARRLEDNGFETVADLLIAERETLTDIPYVAGERADQLLALGEQIVTVEPRDPDFDATESVVTEIEIPRAVQRGEKVLTASNTRSDSAYHTTACAALDVESSTVREWSYVEHHELDECSRCSGDIGTTETDASDDDDEPEPLVDPCEELLDIGLGEKVKVTFADGTGWASPRYVVDVHDPVEWKSADGGTWTTRRVTIADSPTYDGRREDELVLVDDRITLVREYAGGRVEKLTVDSVAVVGRCNDSVYYQLVGQLEDEEETAKPEGNDTWQKYSARGGETA